MQRALSRTRPASKLLLPQHAARSLPPCTCAYAPDRQRQSRRTLSTINPSEISHFASLSATWWDEAGDFNVLQRMNKVRVQFLRDRLSKDGRVPFPPGCEIQFLKGKKVLDVGCGGGLFAERLARLGAQTLAIDASEENVQTATLHASQDPNLVSLIQSGKLEYRTSAVEHLVGDAAAKDGLFDVVCAMEVLEHVEDPRGFLRSLAALTKPGGQVILSTIARTPLAKVLAIDLAESPIVRLAPPGSHTYTKFILPSEIQEFFRSDLHWGVSSSPSSSATASEPERGHLTPDQLSPRLAMEVRGTTYLPWKGEWTLLRKDDEPDSMRSLLSKSVNYFFGAQKPLS